MPPEGIEQLKSRLNRIETVLDILMFSDRYFFQRNIQIQDGRNIQLGTGTGMKIGTATGQKLGFYGVTPVDQPNAVSAPANQGATYVQADVQSIVDRLNDIRSRLQELGLTA